MKQETLKKLVFYYAVFISVFHFWINIWGGISDLWFNVAHFSLLASLGFLIYKAFPKSSNENETIPLYDLVWLYWPSLLLFICFYLKRVYTLYQMEI